MAAPYDGKAPGENTALAGVDEEVVEESLFGIDTRAVSLPPPPPPAGSVMADHGCASDLRHPGKRGHECQLPQGASAPTRIFAVCFTQLGTHPPGLYS